MYSLGHLLLSAPESGAAVCYAKRETEPFIYSVSTNVWEWLPADQGAVRTRRVADIAGVPITKLEVTGPSGRMIVEREAAGPWRLVEPAQGALNPDDLDVVTDILAQLDAAEFLPVKPVALEQPTHTIVVTAGDKTYTLTLAGNEAAWSDPVLYFT